MDKLQELKKIGWVNLDKEQKKEYQALQATPVKVEDKTVSVSKNQLTALMERLDKLEGEKASGGFQTDVGKWKERVDVQKERVLFLKIYTPEGKTEGFPVIARDKTIYRKGTNSSGNPEMTPYTNLTLLTDDGEDKIEIPLLEYGEIVDRVECKIANENVKKLIKDTGKQSVKARTYKYDEYSSVAAPAVPQYVESEVRDFDIVLPDGRELNVKENIINGS